MGKVPGYAAVFHSYLGLPLLRMTHLSHLACQLASFECELLDGVFETAHRVMNRKNGHALIKKTWQDRCLFATVR